MAQGTESRRARWLILLLVWGLIAGLAVLDARATRDYVALLDDSGVVAPDSLPFRRSAPADYADAQTWVRLALQGDGTWQVRHTDIDDPPHGRAVHWSSTFVHLISLAGRITSAVTGRDLPAATEQALAWFNLPMFLAVVVFFSAVVASRAGALIGAVIALGMIGHRWFYLGFAPNYVDHHGLLTAASFGVVLGAVLMGAGWWRDGPVGSSMLPSSHRQARAGMLLSAISGGVGLWISAASIVPTIALVGLAAALAGWWLGPRARDEGARFDANLWRSWGRTGAVVALVGYFIEYAPRHFAMRLEVNHPVYAVAFFGGGYLVSMILEWRTARVGAAAWRWVLAVLAAISPVLVIAIGGSRVFAPLDPRIALLHAGIGEFLSIAAAFRESGAQSLGRMVLGFALLLPALLVLRQRQRDRLLIGFLAIVVAAYAALGAWQVRWWMGASAAELCLLLVAITSIASGWSVRRRWLLAAGLGTVFVAQMVSRIVGTHERVRERTVTAADAMQPLFRDIAATIRASQPTGDVVLLTNPNASTGIGYFGDFKTLGTLYWENAEGLAAAAEIFSAATDDEARALMRARGVTHVAMMSKGDFLRAYLAFARPTAPRESISGTFGYRLQVGELAPRWLRPIPFRARAGTPTTVSLFQVVPDQTESEAAWSAAVARMAAGDMAAAERAFRRAGDAVASEQRVPLYERAAELAYRSEAHALALRLYKTAMSIAATPTLAVNAAWILATSTDGAIRDGRAAIAMVEPLARVHSRDPTILDVYAAALAETGRFADALSVMERMVAVAREHGDSSAEARASERVASYHAFRPWRQ